MKMNIVAIGGGQLDRNKTLSIDKEILGFAGKEHPRLLFVPTASNDDVVYTRSMAKHFTKLGCVVDTLLLTVNDFRRDAIIKKVKAADIIYIGGGNTLRMMKLWRKIGFDKILNQARLDGKILSGLSAGAICWFAYGHSNSYPDKKGKRKFIRVRGLNFVPLLLCPHYHIEREKTLPHMIIHPRLIAIALEEGVALQVKDNAFKIIGIKDAQAYKVYWKNKRVHKEVIAKELFFQPLSILLNK